MNDITVKLIDPMLAKKSCRSIAATLPEWFGIPEANERYEEGMLDRVSFAAYLDANVIGMITLEFPYVNNANIYWMGVKRSFHGNHIGKKLLQIAENHCQELGCSSLTVETLSAKQHDENYLKTYYFYKKSGFKPLFEMYTYDPHNLMVYMQKTLSLNEFSFIDLTHTLSSDVPHWGTDCGFQHKIDLDYADCTTDVKFRTQSMQMVAGIGTHMDAPAHCINHGVSIADIPLQSLIAPCCMIDVSDRAHARYQVSAEDIQLFENQYGIIPKGTFIILYTGWDKWWKQPEKYRNELIFPSISKQAAEMLVARDIVGLGIDTLSPDSGTSDFPVHQIMLGAGKYIIENIANANQLNTTGDFIISLPMKIQDGTEAPIRLVGVQRAINK
jgi:kynurenine formamidase/GNAT superfamily N-acetyltransferase